MKQINVAVVGLSGVEKGLLSVNPLTISKIINDKMCKCLMCLMFF